MEFHLHDSEFRGGAYCRTKVPDGLIIIQRNRDLHDAEPFEAGWPSDKLLLLLDGRTERGWGPYIQALSKLDDIEVVELR